MALGINGPFRSRRQERKRDRTPEKGRDAVDANPSAAERFASEGRSQPTRAGTGADAGLGPALFVWGVWGLMTLAGLAFVHRYGSNVPFQDEYDAVVPVLTGNQPFTLQYLWAQHNEHRIPAGRLLIWLLYQASGDLRATMYFNVLALSAAAAFLVRAARSLRGRLSYLDAFFPVVLLHWGHFANLLWAFQVSFILEALFACLALGIVAASRERLELRGAAALAGCLCGLTLCGASGVALVPALAAWLGYAAIQAGRSGDRQARWNAVRIGLLALVPCALVGGYFYHYHRAAVTPRTPGIGAMLLTGCQFVVMGLGRAVVPLWPYALGALLAGAAVVVGCLLRACWRGEGRCGALGFLAFLAGMAILVAGFGWGRAGFGPEQGFEWRYVTPSAPLLCGLYLAWEAYGPRSLGQLLPACLFTAVCVLLWPNVQSGQEGGGGMRKVMAELEHDLRAGVPASVLARRNTWWLYPSEQVLQDRFEMLRRAGWGEFRHLRDGPGPRPSGEAPATR